MLSDDDILRSLIYQVSKAVPAGKTEQDVTTIITRPMWDAWCRAAGIPVGSEPGTWKGAVNTVRVYGSHTIVVDGSMMFSVSFQRRLQPAEFSQG